MTRTGVRLAIQRPGPARHRQGGAAALVVVMVLFFIISMVAAYTSRNLIFEQRTASNQYRSTQALEAAEAGVEWTLAQLNAGRMTNACIPSTNDSAATDSSFRERYLTVDQLTGNIALRTASGGGSVQPRCVFDGAKWSCSCPLPDAVSPVVTSPSGASFIVQIVRQDALTVRPDLFFLRSNSCTRLSADCLNFNADRGTSGDAVASVRAMIAMRGALTKPPAAALTLAGSLAALPSGMSLIASNNDVDANGMTVQAGGTLPPTATPGLTLVGLPGASALNTAVTGDASLTPPPADSFTEYERRFAMFFGIRPATYERQPGLVRIDCSGGCDAAAINRALFRNPGRAIWLSGDGGTVTLDAQVGSATHPALLIVEGDVAFAGAFTFTGLLYGRKPTWTWTVSGEPVVVGAAVAEGELQLAGSSASIRVNYNAAVLKALRVGYGTFVRVPGSWKDFAP